MGSIPNQNTPDHFAVSEDGYVIPNIPLGARKQIKAICIGFGVSGINVARVLGQMSTETNINLQIYEKNPELGGTWFENK